MANPYYVEPLGGVNIGQGLVGLGSLMREKKKEDQAAARQAAGLEKFQEIYASNDPLKMIEFAAEYPEFQEQASMAFGFTNDQSKAAARDAYSRVLATEDPLQAATELESAVPIIQQLSGSTPENTLFDIQRLREASDEDKPQILNEIKTGVLLAQPDLGESYRSIKGGGFDGFQFGSTEMVKDAKGNLFFATQRRNPSTGEVSTSYSSMTEGVERPQGSVEVAGSYGQTGNEKIIQIQQEQTAKDRSKKNEEFRQQYINSGLTALDMIPKTQDLISLNADINSGRIAQARKKFGDIFGTTDVDLGQFNALAGSLVLQNIRMLGANPTEGERRFLQEITPSLEQGGEVNEALLKDMLEVQKRQVERAKWFTENPEKTIEDFFLSKGLDDFKSSTVDVGTYDSIDKQALDWANANPNDPRSEQIKIRISEKYGE